MQIDTNPLARARVAEMIGMSDSWVRDRMQAGDLLRPGVKASAHVEALSAFHPGLRFRAVLWQV